MDRSGDLVVALRRMTHAVDRHSRYLLLRHGLTGPQVLVLREIGKNEVSTGALARAVSLTQPTVTGILDRLEARGFVMRRRGEQDKRQILVRTTPAARRVLREAPPLLDDGFVRRFGQLAEWEQTQIVAALQRLVALMAVAEPASAAAP